MAILALLLSALAPAISHALSAQRGEALFEVCTSLGAQRVQPDGPLSEQAPASGDLHPFEHCPFCSTHADAVVGPALATALAPRIAASDLLPVAFIATPRVLYAWVSAQPRAPPPFS